MEQFKNLTPKDFDMILDALEQLPFADDSKFMMTAMLDMIIKKESPEEMDRRLSAKVEALKEKKDLLTEDVAILKGKIIAIKREAQAHNTPG
jgi:hypothetical protein